MFSWRLDNAYNRAAEAVKATPARRLARTCPRRQRGGTLALRAAASDSVALNVRRGRNRRRARFTASERPAMSAADAEICRPYAHCTRAGVPPHGNFASRPTFPTSAARIARDGRPDRYAPTRGPRRRSRRFQPRRDRRARRRCPALPRRRRSTAPFQIAAARGETGRCAARPSVSPSFARRRKRRPPRRFGRPFFFVATFRHADALVALLQRSPSSRAAGDGVSPIDRAEPRARLFGEKGSRDARALSRKAARDPARRTRFTARADAEATARNCLLKARARA